MGSAYNSLAVSTKRAWIIAKVSGSFKPEHRAFPQFRVDVNRTSQLFDRAADDVHSDSTSGYIRHLFGGGESQGGR